MQKKKLTKRQRKGLKYNGTGSWGKRNFSVEQIMASADGGSEIIRMGGVRYKRERILKKGRNGSLVAVYGPLIRIS